MTFIIGLLTITISSIILYLLGIIPYNLILKKDDKQYINTIVEDSRITIILKKILIGILVIVALLGLYSVCMLVYQMGYLIINFN